MGNLFAHAEVARAGGVCSLGGGYALFDIYSKDGVKGCTLFCSLLAQSRNMSEKRRFIVRRVTFPLQVAGHSRCKNGDVLVSLRVSDIVLRMKHFVR
ncbi:hypothetical protein HanRHA438_Chr07g0305641 [Helianthus annuus]|nr:hypothetical protein HanIR_Chr07g0318751 [Helianthus annuus]KAJ0908010.1 hypothetical protein HanRHA438_Chr07g0305641 [Helianthus annuus]